MRVSSPLITLGAAGLLAACSSNPQPAMPAPDPMPASAPMATPAAPPAPGAAVAAAPAAATVATPASGVSAPTGAMDLAGSWSFTADIEGQFVSGSMVLRRTGTAWSGDVTPDGMTPGAVRSVVIAGNRATLTVITPDGTDAIAEVTVTADGRSMAGTLMVGNQLGTFSAQRTARE